MRALMRAVRWFQAEWQRQTVWADIEESLSETPLLVRRAVHRLSARQRRDTLALLLSSD